MDDDNNSEPAWLRSPDPALVPSAPPGAAIPDDPPPVEIPDTREAHIRAGLAALKLWWFSPPNTQNERDALDMVVQFIEAFDNGDKPQ